MGTLGGMSDKPKGYGPLDLAVSSVIADLLADAGRGLRAVAADAGMSHNRLGKIKRAKTPPPVVGEIDRIAVALGTTAAAVFLEADRYAARLLVSMDAYAEAEALVGCHPGAISRELRVTRRLVELRREDFARDARILETVERWRADTWAN